MRGETALRLNGGAQAADRGREGGEESVALCVDLGTTVCVERRAEDVAVLALQVRVAAPQRVQQPSRSLDIGQQQCDGSAG